MVVPFSPPDITEREIQAVAEVLRSGWITTGPATKEFERQIAEYVHTSKAVCLNSATACMELTLRLLGVGPGDEVITSAYTYTASASVVTHVGAKLVLVDCEKGKYHLDYEKVEKAITSKTKVIIPVDIGGVMCDYSRLFQIVEEKKKFFQPNNELQAAFGRVVILADSAHAFGASQKGKMCGEVADFTSFSFHAVKNLTTAEGGAVVWRDIPGVDNDWIYQQYMLLSLHGQSKDALAKAQLGAWEYDIVAPNYKCNMTNIMAAIGVVQLKRYPEILEKRKKIIQTYDSICQRFLVEALEHFTDINQSSGHLYLVRIKGFDVKERNDLIIRMAEMGVATNVHYKPLPMHTAYKNMGFDIMNYPNSYAQYKNEITLPLHTCLTDEQVKFVVECFSHCIIVNKYAAS